mmetsp:Transcript_16213/g.27856  ORF Transcript_16213/g.27856 Transcript_16213/m.27856 type:complete len:90 (+) Transcript_16213:274-543(+)
MRSGRDQAPRSYWEVTRHHFMIGTQPVGKATSHFGEAQPYQVPCDKVWSPVGWYAEVKGVVAAMDHICGQSLHSQAPSILKLPVVSGSQ